MKNLISLLIVSLVVFSANAQQEAQYSFYMFNNLYFNPAYAGKQESINVEVLHREQWQFFGVGKEINGAPQSSTISFHAPFKRSNNALGFMFHNDIIGPFNNSTFTLNYAYRVPLGQKLKLSFGVRGGYRLYHVNNIDFVNPDAVGDQMNGAVNLHKFNVGAGVYLWNKNDKFYVGFSVPQILQNTLFNGEDLNPNNSNHAQENLHYFATAGVVIGKESSKFKIYPSTLMKFTKNVPIDFDLNLNFLFYNRIWLGAGYRFGGNIFAGENNRIFDEYGKIGRGDAVIFMLRAMISKNIELGYAYDHTLSTLGDFNTGSHEFLLQFKFNKAVLSPDGVRITTPRYVNYF